MVGGHRGDRLLGEQPGAAVHAAVEQHPREGSGSRRRSTPGRRSRTGRPAGRLHSSGAVPVRSAISAGPEVGHVLLRQLRRPLGRQPEPGLGHARAARRSARAARRRAAGRRPGRAVRRGSACRRCTSTPRRAGGSAAARRSAGSTRRDRAACAGRARPSPAAELLHAWTIGYGGFNWSPATIMPNPRVKVSRSATVTGRTGSTVSSSGRRAGPARAGRRARAAARSTGSSRSSRSSSASIIVAAAITGLVIEAIRNGVSRRIGDVEPPNSVTPDRVHPHVVATRDERDQAGELAAGDPGGHGVVQLRRHAISLPASALSRGSRIGWRRRATEHRVVR